MIKTAITGNIASGKSTVENILISKGYKVLDTDKVSHELLTIKDSELYFIFKDYNVFENGEFSREKLGRLVFSNIVLKRALETILHPKIEEKIKEFFYDNKNENIIFVSIPLVFEANMTNLFDKIVFICADDTVRLERLIKRNNYDIEYAKQRINSQMPQVEKIKKSDLVIDNNKSIDSLEYDVMRALKLLQV